MANHFYAYISRMRCVKRWALMRNTEEENIQEHSHMVACEQHSNFSYHTTPAHR